MNITFRRDTLLILVLVLVLVLVLSFFLFTASAADAGMYVDSAHGDQAAGSGDYGVNRSGTSGFPTDYPIGFCTHCHEQHASIGGSEPSPTGGPSEFLLFYYPSTPSQTDNFCYKCHTGTGSLQYSVSGITNQLYSERAGGWNLTPDDVLESFSYSSPGTSHNLNNISTFIAAEWSSYSSDSNPCVACHNPHAAQGDPIGNGGGATAAKSSSTRGWVVSRPSLHSTDNDSWGIQGDDTDEQMSDYAAGGGDADTYQAPYRYNSTSAYEPDGSATTDGSNLADFVSFCTDCHDDSNSITTSTTLGNGRTTLYTFDWSADKHGKGDATNDGVYGGVTIDDVIAPYTEASVTDYVLSCLDCHEPHGSANLFLIREGVNGGTAVTDVEKLASVTPDNDKTWKSLCSKCHDTSLSNNKAVHHRAYAAEFGSSYSGCIYCHEPLATDMRNCIVCHFHGNDIWPESDEYGGGDHTYKDGGATADKMF